MKRHHVRLAGHWTGLTVAGVAVAVIFFALGAVLRLLSGPVSLGPLAAQIGGAIDQAVPGVHVRYDEAALEWSRDEGRLNLVVLGAKVYDRDDRLVAQAPKAEIDLAAAPVLQGRAVVRRIALVGVRLTLVHTMDGALRLAVEGGQGESDVLQQLRAALSNTSGPTTLKSFAIRKAKLAFSDARTGLFLVAPEASLQIANATGGALTAAITADIVVSGRKAKLDAQLSLPADGDKVSGDLSLQHLDVSALGRNAAALAFLKPYALAADITGSFVLDHRSTRLAYADFGLHATGLVEGLGHPLHVRDLRLVGRYDGRTGRVLIDDGTLAGNELRAHLSGSGDLAFDPRGSLKSGTADLSLDKIAVNMPGVMQNPVTLAHAGLQAHYTPADGTITLERLAILSGPLSATLSGTVVLSEDKTPSIALTGSVAKLSVADLLHYWPLAAAPGARDWIAHSVSAGSVGPAAIKVDIPAGALDLPALPENALSVSFPLADGKVAYMAGLTPLTQLQGTGLLTGDTFKASIAGAIVTPPHGGPLIVSGGSVTIPNLHAPETAGEIKAHVEGAFADVLSLIDEKPLGYPSRFHIATASAKGSAAVDLDFHVPMRRDLSVDSLGIGVNGTVSGLALTLGTRAIDNGTANFHIDNAGLHVGGTIGLAGAALTVAWDEAFKAAKNGITTHVTASGVLDGAARAKLGFPAADYVTGPMPVSAVLTGRRGQLQTATVDAKLTDAAIALDLMNYTKPAGVPAQMHLLLHMTQGALASGEMTLTGTGLNAQGTASFSPGGALTRIDLPTVHAGPANDFTLHAQDSPATGFKLSISGRSADGTGLGRIKLDKNSAGANKTSAAAANDTPFQVEVNLERLALRDGVTLSPFALSVSGVGLRPQSLALSGGLSKTAKLSGDLITSDGERHLRLQSNDAGLLFKGLFGFDSMRGGKLDLDAALSPTPSKQELANKQVADYGGTLKIADFTVINQPFLTRLFSAGSIVGLSDLMGGKGIAIDTLEAPFRMQNGVLNIHDARASGPSVGATASGYLDRRNDTLALEGALVPVYGLNSVLGAIPLLGDVLVSKQGEGIFGVTYDISGNADEPKIAVNPLSMLTPGILRRIFEGTPHAPPAAEAKSTPKKNTPQKD